MTFIEELISSRFTSGISIEGTVIVSVPLPAGHSPGDEPEAVSVLAEVIASRREQAPSFATTSELIETGMTVACACIETAKNPSALSVTVEIIAKNLLPFNDPVSALLP
jgi:hypothetical protein